MPELIPAEFLQFVQRELASGKFRSEEEVVSAGLRLLQEQERRRDALLDDIQLGIDQLDAGNGITVTDEESHRQFFASIEQRGQERLAAKRNKS